MIMPVYCADAIKDQQLTKHNLRSMGIVSKTTSIRYRYAVNMDVEEALQKTCSFFVVFYIKVLLD